MLTDDGEWLGFWWGCGVSLDRALCHAIARELGGKVYGHPSRRDMRAGVQRTVTNCSVAVAEILAAVYGERVRDEWEALMVGDPSQPFSPIDAVVRLGIGERTDSPRPGCWSVVQGWRKLDSNGWVPNPSPVPNGHVLLWYEPPSVDLGAGILVNANTSRPWGKRLTWGEVRGMYPAGVELAALSEP